MSSGLFADTESMVIKPADPLQVVSTFVHIRKRARAENWTREQVRDVLEQLGLIPYTARPGYVQGHRPDEPRKK